MQDDEPCRGSYADPIGFLESEKVRGGQTRSGQDETQDDQRGKVGNLGADCIAKEMRTEHLELLKNLLERAGVTGVRPEEFKRYGSARTLYNFNIDNADAY